MKNITPIENDFQNFGASAAERINKLTAAIKAAPGDTLKLISAAIKAETDSAVRNWLIRFREALQPLSVEVRQCLSTSDTKGRAAGTNGFSRRFFGHTTN